MTQSNLIEYREVNGTSYHRSTPQAVIDILENNLRNRRQQRIKIHYGDVLTGKDWCEIHDVTGYVGRSTGYVKIPLLIYNSNSTGGSGILDHCIVKITESKKPYRVLYQHPKYHIEELI